MFEDISCSFGKCFALAKQNQIFELLERGGYICCVVTDSQALFG